MPEMEMCAQHADVLIRAIEHFGLEHFVSRSEADADQRIADQAHRRKIDARNWDPLFMASIAVTRQAIGMIINGEVNADGIECPACVLLTAGGADDTEMRLYGAAASCKKYHDQHISRPS